MFLKQLFLVFIGLSAGGIIAAGIFAFIVTIGAVVRMVGKTHTSSHIRLYEDVIVAGGTVGNLIYFYSPSLKWLPFSHVLFGLFSGIFVGCLVMSLAETLDALPIMNRRIRLAVGIQYIILSIALGKTVGSWIYFFYQFGLK